MITPLAALRSRSSVKAADVIVYRDGDYAVAVDRFGNEIARSTDHAEVIQRAIDEVLKNGGIIFLKGEFVLNKMVEQKDNTVVVGYKAKVVAAKSFDTLWRMHGSHTYLYGLELDGNYLITGAIVSIRKLSTDTKEYKNIVVKDCIIKNIKQDTGEWLMNIWDGTARWELKDVVIENNVFEDSSERPNFEALVVSYSYNVVIKNNTFLRVGNYGIQAFRSKHIKIISNYIEPEEDKDITAIRSDSYDVIIENNTIKNAYYGIVIVGQKYSESGMRAGKVRVRNNIVLNTKYPLQVYGGYDDDLEDVIVEGNVFEGRPDINSEIVFGRNPTGYTGKLVNFKFVNNVVRDLGYGIAVYSYIKDYPIIEGNIIMNFGRYVAGASYLRSGIRIASGAKAIIRGNRFVDLQDSPTSYYAIYEYDDAGTSIIEDNAIDNMIASPPIRIANPGTLVRRNKGADPQGEVEVYSDCTNIPTTGLYKGHVIACYDSANSKWVLKVWDGSAWQTIG